MTLSDFLVTSACEATACGEWGVGGEKEGKGHISEFNIEIILLL